MIYTLTNGIDQIVGVYSDLNVAKDAAYYLQRNAGDAYKVYASQLDSMVLKLVWDSTEV